MANRSFSRKLVDFIVLPVLTGLVVAAVLLSLFPELRNMSDRLENLGDIAANPLATGYSDPVSYAQAVKRAAPSVVNIYTRTVRRQNNHPLLNNPLLGAFMSSNSKEVRTLWDLGLLDQQVYCYQLPLCTG